MATTRCPASSSPPGQSTTSPVASIPSTRGKVTPSARPSRVCSSDRLRPEARTRIRTHPGAGTGIGIDRTTRASGPPGAARTAARIVAGIVDVTPEPGVRPRRRRARRATSRARRRPNRRGPDRSGRSTRSRPVASRPAPPDDPWTVNRSRLTRRSSASISRSTRPAATSRSTSLLAPPGEMSMSAARSWTRLPGVVCSTRSATSHAIDTCWSANRTRSSWFHSLVCTRTRCSTSWRFSVMLSTTRCHGTLFPGMYPAVPVDPSGSDATMTGERREPRWPVGVRRRRR